MNPEDRIAELERRIVDLEVKSSFQERTLDDLDLVLRGFTARVEVLERELSHLRGAPSTASPSTAEVLAGLGDDLP